MKIPLLIHYGGYYKNKMKQMLEEVEKLSYIAGGKKNLNTELSYPTNTWKN